MNVNIYSKNTEKKRADYILEQIILEITQLLIYNK